MAPTCPHCHQEIPLVGAGDLDREFGIGPNALQHARETGRFPEPWLSFGNRKIYLRHDIEEYVSERGRAKVEKAVKDILTSIETLPEAERSEAMELLNEQLDGGAKPRSKSRR